MTSKKMGAPSAQITGGLIAAESRRKKLKIIRKYLNLTQEKMGEIIDFGKDQISKMERGEEGREVNDKKMLEIVEKLRAKYKDLNVYIELFDICEDIETFSEIIRLNRGEILKNRLKNIPKIDYQFIGRENEIAKLLKDLSPDSTSSLLRITGIGGIGKSALAIEVVKQCEVNRYFDAIIWYPPNSEKMPEIKFSYNNDNDQFIYISFSFEELLVNIIDTINPHLSQRYLLPHDLNTTAIQLLSKYMTLIVIDGLDKFDNEQLSIFIDSVPAPSMVLITDRRLVQDSKQILLLKLLYNESIKMIQDLCKSKLDDQEQTYLANESEGIPFALKWIIRQISFNYWSIDSLSENLLNNKCCTFLSYIFQKSYDQLSPNSRVLASSLSLLTVPVTGIFLYKCNKIDEKDAKDSLSQLIDHGLIKKKTGGKNFKLVDQIFEMSPLATDFFRYKKECGEAKLKENIIRFLAKEIRSKIYRSKIFPETENLQEYLNENFDLIANFSDDLDQNEAFNDARSKYARNIRFPRKRVTKEITGFSLGCSNKSVHERIL